MKQYLGKLEDKEVYQDGDNIIWGDNFTTPVGGYPYKEIMRRLGVSSYNKNGYQKYFETSRNIHNDAIGRFQELQRTMASIEENHKGIMNDPNVSLSAKEQERVYYAKCQVRYKQEYENIKADVEEKLKSVYENMAKEVETFYTPKGAEIDADTLSLINSGIKLTGDEFDSLTSKYANNYTMIRLLSDYAKKNDIMTNLSVSLSDYVRDNQPGKNAEMGLLKRLHDTTRIAIDPKDPIKSRVRIENYDGIYNDIMDEMNNMPVKHCEYDKVGGDAE